MPLVALHSPSSMLTSLLLRQALSGHNPPLNDYQKIFIFCKLVRTMSVLYGEITNRLRMHMSGYSNLYRIVCGCRIWHCKLLVRFVGANSHSDANFNDSDHSMKVSKHHLLQ